MVIKTLSITLLVASFNFILLEIGYCQSPITFYNQLSVENHLKDREILKLDRDEAGHFWLLGTSAIQKYDGRFVTENISHSVVNPKYFLCLSDNSILLVSQEAQVYKIDKEEKTLEEISTEVPTCPNCEIKDINLIGEDLILYYENDGEHLVFKTSHESSYASFQLIDTLTLSQPLAVSNFFKIGQYYLISTEDERLFRSKNGEDVELALPNTFRATTEALVSNYVDSSSLYFSLPKRKGTFYFNNGNFKIIHEHDKLAFAKKDRKGKTLLALSRTYNHSEDVYVDEGDSIVRWPEVTNITQTYIDAYVEDLDEQLLLASHSGLNYIKMRKDGITPSHQSLGLTNGFGNVILSFAELPTGEIYYVKENKGIFKYNGAAGHERLPLSDKLLNNLICRYEPTSNEKYLCVL